LNKQNKPVTRNDKFGKLKNQKPWKINFVKSWLLNILNGELDKKKQQFLYMKQKMLFLVWFRHMGGDDDLLPKNLKINRA